MHVNFGVGGQGHAMWVGGEVSLESFAEEHE